MRALMVLALALLVAGCASNLPPAMFMPQTLDVASEPRTAGAIGEVTVTLEPGVGRHLSADNFKVAVSEILKRSNLFGNDLSRPYHVHVTVNRASFPSAGFTMTSELTAHYKVIDHAGTTVFDEEVAYIAEAGFSDELLGSARALLAFQRANDGHFDMLVDKLGTALASEGETPAGERLELTERE